MLENWGEISQGMKPIREAARLDWEGAHMKPLVAPAKPISLPPAPLNGGKLETAPPKVGKWIWQPKVDDRRVVIHAPTGAVWNQYGEPSVAMRDIHKFEKALHQIKIHSHVEWLDAGLMEYRHGLMRGCVIVFDAILNPTFDYTERREQLEQSFSLLPTDMANALKNAGGCIKDSVFLVNEWQERPLESWQFLQDQNKLIGHKFYEGLVAKRLNSHYPMSSKPKTQTYLWIKHRWTD